MSKIHQCDQYAVPVTIKLNGATLTEQDAEAVIIRLGTVEHRWPDGELKYWDGEWLLPLTAKETAVMGPNEEYQVCILIDGYEIRSDVETTEVQRSIIREVQA